MKNALHESYVEMEWGQDHFRSAWPMRFWGGRETSWRRRLPERLAQQLSLVTSEDANPTHSEMGIATLPYRSTLNAILGKCIFQEVTETSIDVPTDPSSSSSLMHNENRLGILLALRPTYTSCTYDCQYVACRHDETNLPFPTNPGMAAEG